VVGQPSEHCLALVPLYGGLGGRLCGIAPGAALAAVRVDCEKAVSGLLNDGAKQVSQRSDGRHP
jgi:hypothetical protein